jgi:formylglycine-generating enzyme required for sulfatase activity
MGSPKEEAGRFDGEEQHWRAIGRRFALATKAVTVAQFQRFLKAHSEAGEGLSKQVIAAPASPILEHSAPNAECPIIAVTWYEAAAYCRWLSEQEGLPEHEMVYPPVRRILQSARDLTALVLPPRHLGRRGYRLPTEAEWELACRAGAATSRYYGSSLDLLPRYAWFSGNSGDRTWPVGQKRPNDHGLFDMHGNAWTWCQGRWEPYPPGPRSSPAGDQEDDLEVISTAFRALRGSAFGVHARLTRSAQRIADQPGLRIGFNNGLRVCRSLP